MHVRIFRVHALNTQLMAIKMLKELFPAGYPKFMDEHPTVRVEKLQGSGSKGGGDGSKNLMQVIQDARFSLKMVFMERMAYWLATVPALCRKILVMGVEMENNVVG
ncbi:hypothetical protein DUI87_06878 [Hirundo rustica rustica]|uniref:Uncharacterized protein n=1 Tax=Hirundo rustica rustica TaxID=333673 RepID=A0A3M0KNM6_HIRRU|nr:hypothetical protein DUI87_06878 [Hirundo rustica rustica]